MTWSHHCKVQHPDNISPPHLKQTKTNFEPSSKSGLKNLLCCVSISATKKSKCKSAKELIETKNVSQSTQPSKEKRYIL